MIKIRSNEGLEATTRRIELLHRKAIMDSAEAAGLVALLAAVETWEETRKVSPLRRAKPRDFAT